MSLTVALQEKFGGWKMHNGYQISWESFYAVGEILLLLEIFWLFQPLVNLFKIEISKPECLVDRIKPGQQLWFDNSIVVELCSLSAPGQKCKSSLNIATLTAPDTFCSSRRWWLPHVWGLGGKTLSPHSHSARSPVVYKLSSLAFGLVKRYEASIFLRRALRRGW